MDQTFVLRQEGFHPESAAGRSPCSPWETASWGWRGNYEEGYGQFRGGVEGCYLNGFYETEKIRYGEIAYGYAEESQTMLNITSSQRVLLEAEGTALHPGRGGKAPAGCWRWSGACCAGRRCTPCPGAESCESAWPGW